jgi:hypothetical protein
MPVRNWNRDSLIAENYRKRRANRILRREKWTGVLKSLYLLKLYEVLQRNKKEAKSDDEKHDDEDNDDDDDDDDDYIPPLDTSDDDDNDEDDDDDDDDDQADDDDNYDDDDDDDNEDYDDKKNKKRKRRTHAVKTEAAKTNSKRRRETKQQEEKDPKTNQQEAKDPKTEWGEKLEKLTPQSRQNVNKAVKQLASCNKDDADDERVTAAAEADGKLPYWDKRLWQKDAGYSDTLRLQLPSTIVKVMLKSHALHH